MTEDTKSAYPPEPAQPSAPPAAAGSGNSAPCCPTCQVPVVYHAALIDGRLKQQMYQFVTLDPGAPERPWGWYVTGSMERHTHPVVTA